MLPAVYKALTDDAAVYALVGNRVYRHGMAPQGVTAPYVTWHEGGGTASNTFNGADADQWRVQVDCWSDKDGQVETVAAAVRAVMEANGNLIAYVADGRDTETQRFRFGMSFDWILGRNF